MPQGDIYTDEQILKNIKEHLVEKKLSKYSMHKPVWQTVLQRMEKDSDFKAKVKTLEAQALAEWEQFGLDGFSDKDFNVGLFKMYAGSKKSFQSYEVNELENRLEKLEGKANE
jgi:hypothetical protein